MIRPSAELRHDSAFERRWHVRGLQVVAGIYSGAFHQLRQHTQCPVPPRGAALVACNHTAGLDPVIVQAVCPRPIVWVMTREHFDRRSLGWFFRWTNMIPIDRTGRDTRAWREAIRHLKAGHVVGVFPEGRIEREGKLLPFQTGVALLALRGGVDVFPVYVDGLQRNKPMLHTFIRPQYPSIAWGEPLHVARGRNRRALQPLTDELQACVELLRQRYPAPRQRGRSLLASIPS